MKRSTMGMLTRMHLNGMSFFAGRTRNDTIDGSRRRRAASGFTLLELMLVIGVIALILAMIFGAVTQVTGKGKQAQCAGNARVWGQALLLALSDNNGQFPSQGSNPAFADPTPVPAMTNAWYNLLPIYAGLDPMSNLWIRNTMPRPRSKSAFICPSAPPTEVPSNARDYYANYAINLWVEASDRGCSGNGAPTASGFSRFLRISQIAKPASFVAMAENPTGIGDNGNAGYRYGQTHAEFMGDPVTGDAFRHNSRANVIFADGHASAYSKTNIYNNGMDKYWNYGGLQWNPDNKNLDGACN
jgi:prepilin-type processing-associated H-X9-DG protein/prepilin-type N-terminal cleavage/methylation domain-containing protein